MKRILGIDPGSQFSAWIIYQPGMKPIFNGFGKEPNDEVCKRIESTKDLWEILVIEKVATYINPYAKSGGLSGDVIDTAIVIGRFQQVANYCKKESILMTRRAITTTVTGLSKCGDKEVRAALIKRFGEQGTLNNPGPCYGISSDIWSALACSAAYIDKEVIQPDKPQPPFQPGFLP